MAPEGAELATLIGEAKAFAAAAHSPNTQAAYESDWRDFTGWCFAHRLPACPAAPETAALYITALARTSKPSTIGRRLSAISRFHRAAGFPSPTAAPEVRTVLSGIRRQKGTAPNRKKPMTGTMVVRAVANLGDGLIGLRNRALLLITYAGALRRSEAVALRWENIDFGPEGVTLTIARSKTDPTGKGSAVGIPFGSSPETCPVRALETWKAASQQTGGPVFPVIGRAGKIFGEALSDRAVARLVKQSVAGLGLDPAAYSGHSLRAGLATTAAANGAAERKIMDQTRHRSVATLRSYIREGNLFRNNAASLAEL